MIRFLAGAVRYIGMVVLLVALRTSFAWGQSGLLQHDPNIGTAYGLNMGIGIRNSDPIVHPIFNPYYDVSLGRILFTTELFFSYQNFQTLDFLHLSGFTFDSYGFGGSVKKIFSLDADHFLAASAGVELSVLQTRVSVGLPITAGLLLPLSQAVQLNLELRMNPLVYLGQNPGYFASALVGLRLPYIP